MLNLNDLFDIPFMKGYAIARNGNVYNVVTGTYIDPVGSTHVIVKIPENSNNSYSVARLLMETFVGPLSADIEFINGNSNDVRLDNIRYQISTNIQIADDTFVINGCEFRCVKKCHDYLISQYGTVYSIKRRLFLSLSFNYQRYCTATITDDSGIRSPRKIHRLVYEAFCGDLDPALVIDHIDNRRYNNFYKNLSQITPKENVHKASCTKINAFKHWEKDNVIKICDGIQNNLTIGEIANLINVDLLDSYDNLLRLIRRLIVHQAYPEISSSYDFSKCIQEANQDYTRKGRLRASDIEYIWFNPDNLTSAALGRKFNCVQPLISLIRNGHNWTSVTDTLAKNELAKVQRLSKA